MKAIGIIGFKKSGKTTLGVRLSKALVGLGFKVGVIKHASKGIDFPETDSFKYSNYAKTVVTISSDKSEVVLSGETNIEEILKYFYADIVVIEGFKKEKTFPKIICLRTEDEEVELSDGLGIFTASFDKKIADFDILNDDQLKIMARKAIKKAFKLPTSDCGNCGYDSCYELAKAIVNGKATVERCSIIDPRVSIKVEGSKLALDTETSDLLKNTAHSMISHLKGFKNGTIEIKIKTKKGDSG